MNLRNIGVLLFAIGGVAAQIAVNPWWEFDYWLIVLVFSVILVLVGSAFVLHGKKYNNVL